MDINLEHEDLVNFINSGPYLFKYFKKVLLWLMMGLLVIVISFFIVTMGIMFFIFSPVLAIFSKVAYKEPKDSNEEDL